MSCPNELRGCLPARILCFFIQTGLEPTRPTDAGKTPEALSEAFTSFSNGNMPAVASTSMATGSQVVTQEAIQKSMRLLLLVRAYQASCSCRRDRRSSMTTCLLCGLVAARSAGNSSCATNFSAGLRPLQVNGHFLANLDPLGLDHRPPPIELDPALYGFTEADLDKE